LSWISNTEVVSNISPAVGVHVEVLDVSHFSITGWIPKLITLAQNYLNLDESTHQLVSCIEPWTCDEQQIQTVVALASMSSLLILTPTSSGYEHCHMEPVHRHKQLMKERWMPSFLNYEIFYFFVLFIGIKKNPLVSSEKYYFLIRIENQLTRKISNLKNFRKKMKLSKIQTFQVHNLEITGNQK